MKGVELFNFLTGNDHYKSFYEFLKKLKAIPELNFNYLEEQLRNLSDQFTPVKNIDDFTDENQFFQLRTGIIQNNIKNQSLRVPLIKFKISIFQNLKKLETRIEYLKKILALNYKDNMEALGLKTQTEKNSIIDIFLKEGYFFIEELKILDETINLMLSNIDENKWVAKSVVDLINVSLKHPYI